jgi:hypothetical protein
VGLQGIGVGPGGTGHENTFCRRSVTLTNASRAREVNQLCH